VGGIYNVKLIGLFDTTHYSGSHQEVCTEMAKKLSADKSFCVDAYTKSDSYQKSYIDSSAIRHAAEKKVEKAVITERR